MSCGDLYASGIVLLLLITLAAVITFAVTEGRKRLERTKAKLAQNPGEKKPSTLLMLTIRTDKHLYGMSVRDPEVGGVSLDASTVNALAPGQLLDRLNAGETSLYVQRMIAEYKKACQALTRTLGQSEPPKFLEFDIGTRLTLIPVTDIVDVRFFLEVESDKDEDEIS